MKNVGMALALAALAACGSSAGAPGQGAGDGGPSGPAPIDRAPQLNVDCRHRGSGRDIQVGNPTVESGPGVLQVARIADVDWNNLQPGDTVRIFWRAEPYREKFLIRGRGTPAQPIRVCGVPGPEGDLPMISGRDAVTRPDLDYGDLQYGMEDLGIVTIYHRNYFIRPEHIVIEGLKIGETMADPGRAGSEQAGEYIPIDEYSYTATNGTLRPYYAGAACLRVQEGMGITIRGNELSHCGNGLFVLSRIPEAQIARNLVIEGNHIHHNGAVNSDQFHNAYVQGINVLIQGNRFGDARPGSMGGNLKMRTAGDVVRYNYFGTGARVLDMVEVEDHAEWVLPWRYAEYKAEGGLAGPGDDARVAEAWQLYQRSYVYGNLFRNRGPDAASSPVHYSYDNLQEDRRPGTLYFYHNTILLQTDFEPMDIVHLFDQGPWNGNSDPDFPNDFASYAKIEAFHNVVFLGSEGPGAQRSYFEFTRFRADKLQLGAGPNWISSGWDAEAPGYGQEFPGFGNRLSEGPGATYPGGDETHHVSGAESLLTGGVAPVDLSTFKPTAGSPIVGRAGALPTEIPEELAPLYQIDPATGAVSARNTATTLGAIQ